MLKHRKISSTNRYNLQVQLSQSNQFCKSILFMAFLKDF